MAVTLIRAYNGFAAGSVVEFPAELEAALVAQKLATSGGTLTTGAQSSTVAVTPWVPVASGFVSIAAAASSLVVSNPAITSQSKAFAAISQSAADGTLTSIVRVFCQNGSMTITGNAGATAAVRVAYIVFN